MKKTILMASAIFLIMSSFNTIETKRSNIEKTSPYDCAQSCADTATIIAHATNLDFDGEAFLFFSCVTRYCNQQ